MRYRIEDGEGKVLYAGNDFNEAFAKMHDLKGKHFVEERGSY
jgi:hypothetical protein